jgi:hypothetical protein
VADEQQLSAELLPLNFLLIRQKLALEDFASLDAGRANANTLANTIYNCLDRLQVRVPATARDVMRVRDVVAELRSFVADFTYLCHDKLSVKRNFVRLLNAMPRENKPGSIRRNPQTSADRFRMEDLGREGMGNQVV